MAFNRLVCVQWNACHLYSLCTNEGNIQQKSDLNKFEFGGSFGMSLEGDCHGVEVTPNLEFFVTFV